MHLFRSKKTQAQKTFPQAVLYSPDNPQNSQHNANSSRNHGQSVAGALHRQAAQFMPAVEPPYRSLVHSEKEIRLLSVHAGNEHAPMNCTMVYTSLYTNKQSPYETVSYCWGEPHQTVVQINNCPVNTTSTAANVLRRIRCSDRNRLVWIDAICIDQRNDEEKGRQVAIMGEIYRNSTRNIVWLGDCLNHPDRVKEAVRSVLADARTKTGDFKTFYRTTHPNSLKGEPSRDGDLLNSKIDLRPLKELFASPWFGRIWVVQEAALAPRNLCHFGPLCFQLSDILRVAVWLRYNLKRILPDLAASYGLSRASELWYFADHEIAPPEFHFNGCRMPLATVCRRLQDFDSSDPHDRIYALFGFLLHRGQTMPELKPAYDRNLSDLFRDATRALIHETGRLDILQYLSVNANEQPHSTHSWVVPFDCKWRNVQRPEPLRPIFYADSMSTVSGSTKADSNPDILALRGFETDVIKLRTKCMLRASDGELEVRSATAALLTAANMMNSLQKEYPSRRMIAELATTLMGGANQSGERLTPLDLECFLAFMDFIRDYNTLPPSALPWKQSEALQLTKPVQMAILFMASARRACLHRRIFVTEAGRMGVGPGGLRDGDGIAVLHGSRVPYALRWLGKNRFSIIGECYVHGVMEGEIVRALRAEGKGERATSFYIV